jgi:hypothetical protein
MVESGSRKTERKKHPHPHPAKGRGWFSHPGLLAGFDDVGVLIFNRPILLWPL